MNCLHFERATNEILFRIDVFEPPSIYKLGGLNMDVFQMGSGSMLFSKEGSGSGSIQKPDILLLTTQHNSVLHLLHMINVILAGEVDIIKFSDEYMILGG